MSETRHLNFDFNLSFTRALALALPYAPFRFDFDLNPAVCMCCFVANILLFISKGTRHAFCLVLLTCQMLVRIKQLP